MWNNWFRKAIREAVLACSGETTTFRHQSSARSVVEQCARQRGEKEGGKTEETRTAAVQLSVTSRTWNVSRRATETDRWVDGWMRQWILSIHLALRLSLSRTSLNRSVLSSAADCDSCRAESLVASMHSIMTAGQSRS